MRDTTISKTAPNYSGILNMYFEWGYNLWRRPSKRSKCKQSFEKFVQAGQGCAWNEVERQTLKEAISQELTWIARVVTSRKRQERFTIFPVKSQRSRYCSNLLKNKLQHSSRISAKKNNIGWSRKVTSILAFNRAQKLVIIAQQPSNFKCEQIWAYSRATTLRTMMPCLIPKLVIIQ